MRFTDGISDSVSGQLLHHISGLDIARRRHPLNPLVAPFGRDLRGGVRGSSDGTRPRGLGSRAGRHRRPLPSRREDGATAGQSGPNGRAWRTRSCCCGSWPRRFAPLPGRPLWDGRWWPRSWPGSRQPSHRGSPTTSLVAVPVRQVVGCPRRDRHGRQQRRHNADQQPQPDAAQPPRPRRRPSAHH
jgi:hypothetical protein